MCYHPCEDGCSRVQVDDAVSIHSIERFLGDMAIEQNWPMPTPKSETGKKVLVIGAGPSGLSAAYHLRLLGGCPRIDCPTAVAANWSKKSEIFCHPRYGRYSRSAS
ncbi:hypothetical protein J7439_15355 [Salinisphaera sp. G21_0]|nr:hypothetical protein [Salinisphaera sp. G21_0]